MSAQPLGDMVLRPIRGHHAFESCVEQLGTAIRLGVYSLGSVLPPERELAERMGVSRASLREAIAALRSAGFVETKRGRGGGTVVRYEPQQPGSGTFSFPREELLDALDFRRIVEPGAAYQAARMQHTEEQRAMLIKALEEVDSTSRTAAHRQADSRLHLAIAGLAGSPMLLNAVTEVQKHLHDMLIAIPVLPTNIDHSHRQHRTIVGAILAGDATRARRAMETHCDDTAALLRGLL